MRIYVFVCNTGIILFVHSPSMPVMVQSYWYNTWYGHSSFENDWAWDPCFRLEQESGFFFNMKYFEEKVIGGEWDEVEKYLSGFTKVDDNRYSMKIFFEIRKQKYLEALDKYGDPPFCFFIWILFLSRAFGVYWPGQPGKGKAKWVRGGHLPTPGSKKFQKHTATFMPFSIFFL